MRRFAWIRAVIVFTLAGLSLPFFAEDDEYVTGHELCAACHDETVEAFVNGPHGRLIAARGEDLLTRSCATCHGPVDLHLEEVSAESINRWPSDAACLSCHPAAAGKMRRATGGHDRQGVACLDCHVAGHPELSGPADFDAKPLLTGPPRELCGDCHGDVRASFALPFAHREGSNRPFECTTCHGVHGDGEVGAWAWVNNGGVCASCHSDKAGPWVFPHAPREVDGCVTCHAPHGSPNPRQLVRRNVLNLCLECHSNVPQRGFHDFTQARFRVCQSCHRAVHGSNTDPRLLDE